VDISEVARRTGLPSSTVRFYEKTGLIKALSSAGERRQFAANVLDQLALIALGQAGGLSLDEIRAMLPVDGSPQVDRSLLLANAEGALKVDRALLRSKADQIDATIKRLRAMSEGLRHAAECPAADHAQCPKFQQLLKVAAGRVKQGKAKARPAISRRGEAASG